MGRPNWPLSRLHNFFLPVPRNDAERRLLPARFLLASRSEYWLTTEMKSNRCPEMIVAAYCHGIQGRNEPFSVRPDHIGWSLLYVLAARRNRPRATGHGSKSPPPEAIH